MKPVKPSVALLCRDDDSSKAVANLLQQTMDLQIVIVEDKVSGKRLIKRRARKLGVIRAFGQLCFIAASRATSSRFQSRVQEIYSASGLDTSGFPLDKVRWVESVNQPQTRELLTDLSPQVVVVNGTRIIGKKTLSCLSAPFLNTHMGITPRYRGVHGGYWALARQDKENCGVTVHLVDEGIDTGNVLRQARIFPDSRDNFHTYPALQLAAAAPLLVDAIKEAALGELQVAPGPGPSELFYHPTLWEYCWNWWRLGVI